MNPTLSRFMLGMFAAAGMLRFGTPPSEIRRSAQDPAVVDRLQAAAKAKRERKAAILARNAERGAVK